MVMAIFAFGEKFCIFHGSRRIYYNWHGFKASGMKLEVEVLMMSQTATWDFHPYVFIHQEQIKPETLVVVHSMDISKYYGIIMIQRFQNIENNCSQKVNLR